MEFYSQSNRRKEFRPHLSKRAINSTSHQTNCCRLSGSCRKRRCRNRRDGRVLDGEWELHEEVEVDSGAADRRREGREAASPEVGQEVGLVREAEAEGDSAVFYVQS